VTTIEQYYEEYWEDPEQYNDPTTPQRQALLRRHLAGVAKGARCVDVGCGRGEFCEFFRSLGYVAAGTDLSKAAIGYAQKHYPGSDFRAGPIEEFAGEWRGSMDFVFSSEVIEHLFDVAGFMATVNSVTKPGGLVILTTPYHGLIKNLSIDLANYSGHYDPLGQHIRFYDKKGLDRVLRLTGFEATVWSGYGRPWPFWKSFFVVARKVKEADVSKIGGNAGNMK
jgi:SAM-dependent methyltransferase